jgi:serine/threonine-protein kinase HipA
MIAQAVETYAGEDSVVQLKKLFERVVLSCYLRDGDAHLKNFGMLYVHPASSRRLAPIYDVVCTDVYPELDGKMALKMHKSKTFPNDAELIAYGNRLGLSNREVVEVLARLEHAYQTVIARCEQDPRYQVDSLLADIQQAVKRMGLRDKSAKTVR